MNRELQTVLHQLCRCLSSLSLAPTVNTELEITACFQLLLSAGVDPNVKVNNAVVIHFVLFEISGENRNEVLFT